MSFCCPITTINPDSGALVGGSALVSSNNSVWDSFAGVWPLNEEGEGDEGEFEDRSPFDLDATGGDGVDPELVPLQDQGVFCQPSQRFNGRQFITVPADSVGMVQGFSVSCWGKIGTYYPPRTWYSRGHDTPDGDRWVFSIGHSFLNQIAASINVLKSDGTAKSYVTNGSAFLTQDQWYHFAVTYVPGVGLKLYVNGVLSGSVAIAETVLQPLTNEGYFSRFNNGGFVTGNLQDVRLHGEPRAASWFLAEHNNYCDSGFFVVGDEES